MSISLWWQRQRKPRLLRRLPLAPPPGQGTPPGGGTGAPPAGVPQTPPPSGEHGPLDPWPETAARKAALNLRRLDPAGVHVFIRDQAACQGTCAAECTFLCPAGVFVPTRTPDGQSHLQVRHELCIECGACRIFCPGDNIEMDYPRGGFGVVHRFG